MKVPATFLTLFLFLLGAAVPGFASQPVVHPAFSEQHGVIHTMNSIQVSADYLTIDDHDADFTAAFDLIATDEDDDDDDTNPSFGARLYSFVRIAETLNDHSFVSATPLLYKSRTTIYGTTSPRYLLQRVFRI